MLAVDISNYTGVPTQDQLNEWKAMGVGLVIPQSVDPPRGYPAGVTRRQIMACREAGLKVDLYFWLWSNSDVEWDMNDKLDLIGGLEDSVRQIWLDVEDTSSAPLAKRLSSIRIGLARLDEWCVAFDKPKTGIYTSIWYWPSYLDNTPEFSERELWDADYDDEADADYGWAEYGGWDLSKRRIKQYRGTTTLAGVGNVDMNVLSSLEEGELYDQPKEDDELPVSQDYKDKFGEEASWADVASNLEGIIDHLSDELSDALDVPQDYKNKFGENVMWADVAVNLEGIIEFLTGELASCEAKVSQASAKPPKSGSSRKPLADGQE